MSGRTIIDARGSFCPGPLMELIGQLKLAEIGAEFEVLSTDRGSAHEIPQWLAKVGHRHLGTHDDAGVWHIVLKKMK